MSSASAVTVAAGMAYGALASDLGGSLRAPAAYTGIVGFKPSPGRLSKAGLITFAARFDIPGVVTRTVPDAALLTALLQGQVSTPLPLGYPTDQL
jgi:aspartyl-tRNA(Asn)/glutamyl-tRNA(Gln) amidotransferase subunit A